MLKVYGGMYANNKDDFDALANTLTNAGFEIAYQSEMSATIIKEVDTLDVNEDTEP